MKRIILHFILFLFLILPCPAFSEEAVKPAGDFSLIIEDYELTPGMTEKEVIEKWGDPVTGGKLPKDLKIEGEKLTIDHTINESIFGYKDTLIEWEKEGIDTVWVYKYTVVGNLIFVDILGFKDGILLELKIM